jgi:short-subunit dehydrogenase
VNVSYINTGFGSRALTHDGNKANKEDFNQLRGYAPEYVAKKILKSLENRETELVLAPFIQRLAIVLRLFAPNLLFWILHRRGQGLLEHEKNE